MYGPSADAREQWPPPALLDRYATGIFEQLKFEFKLFAETIDKPSMIISNPH